MTDLNIDEFMASGAIDEFFQEMMEESGMMEEMMEAYGDDVDVKELQASFESFFKASMGFSDGGLTLSRPLLLLAWLSALAALTRCPAVRAGRPSPDARRHHHVCG